jgi:type I restriction enzyme S subunit
MGTAPPGETYNERGDGLPMIAGAGDYGERFPNPKKWTTAPVRTSQKGDLIICVRATIGDLNWSDRKYCLGRGVAAIRPKRDQIDLSWLSHFINANRGDLARRANGSTFPAIKREDLDDWAIPLPPLAEQKRIAAILDKADAVRRKRRKAVELASDLPRAVFIERFGDPLTNPKGLPIHEVGQHIAFLTSGSRGWAQHYAPAGPRFIRSLDVQMNRITDDDAVFVVPPAGTEAERTRVRPGDVLLTITGSCVGRVAPVPEAISEAYVSQHVSILRLDGGVRPRFLSMFLSDPRGGQYQISRAQYGQTKPGLNLEQIRRFKFPYPTLAEQDRFMQLLDRADALHNRNVSSVQMADDLFNSLVQQAFGGNFDS